MQLPSVAVVLLILIPAFCCFLTNNFCTKEIANENLTSVICRNHSSSSVRLYPIAFQPLGLTGTDEHSLFRTSGNSFGCLTFVMYCGTAQFELRCRNVSAIYTVSISSVTKLLSIDLTGVQNLSTTTNDCKGMATNYFRVYGHVSQFVLIWNCMNILLTGSSIVGYWLFVPLSNTERDNVKVLRYVASKHPAFKPPNDPTRRTLSWDPQSRCHCERFENYMKRAIACNPPMFDETSLDTDSFGKKFADKRSIYSEPKNALTLVGLVLMGGLLMYGNAMYQNYKMDL